MLLGSLESWEALLSVFEEVIHTGLDLLMPVSKVRLNTRDAPQHLKDLNQKRQQAFHKKGADSVQFKFYRNLVNREKKLCRPQSLVERDETLKRRNSINKAFLEPLEEYRLFCPITGLALEKDLPEFLEVSEERDGKYYQNSILF